MIKIRIYRCIECDNRFKNENKTKCPECKSSSLINAEDRSEPKNYIFTAVGLVHKDDLFDWGARWLKKKVIHTHHLTVINLNR